MKGIMLRCMLLCISLVLAAAHTSQSSSGHGGIGLHSDDPMRGNIYVDDFEHRRHQHPGDVENSRQAQSTSTRINTHPDDLEYRRQRHPDDVDIHVDDFEHRRHQHPGNVENSRQEQYISTQRKTHPDDLEYRRQRHPDDIISAGTRGNMHLDHTEYRREQHAAEVRRQAPSASTMGGAPRLSLPPRNEAARRLKVRSYKYVQPGETTKERLGREQDMEQIEKLGGDLRAVKLHTPSMERYKQRAKAEPERWEALPAGRRANERDEALLKKFGGSFEEMVLMHESKLQKSQRAMREDPEMIHNFAYASSAERKAAEERRRVEEEFGGGLESCKRHETALERRKREFLEAEEEYESEGEYSDEYTE